MSRARPCRLAILTALLAGTAASCDRPTAPDADGDSAGRRAPSLRDELVPLVRRAAVRSDRAVSEAPAQGSTSRREAPEAERTTPADAEIDRYEASAEAWPSERLSGLSAARLRRLLEARDGESIEALSSSSVRCGALRPTPLRVLRDDDSWTLLRHDDDATSPAHHGKEGLERELGALRAAFAGGALHVAVKIVGVELDEESQTSSVRTRALVELSGADAKGAGSRQITATWLCRWTHDPTSPELDLRLLELRVVAHTEALRKASEGTAATLFADVTRAAFGTDPLFGPQQLRGIEHWTQRITRLGDLALTGHHGLAVGDVDGDGREDLFVCDGGSLPNRLYLQLPDGTLRDHSREAGLDWLEDSRSALLVDLDGDGDQDLVVATIAMVAFAENTGGRFALRGGHPGAPHPFGLAAADFDLDGDLDVHVCVYAGPSGPSAARDFEARSPVPFHDARNGGRNVLLANLGGFRFADVTDEVGLDVGNGRWSLAAAWEDFDRDGDPDLYVANDFGRNNLYRNDALPDGSRRLVDIAGQAGVEDRGAGMSVSWGDHDRDGDADLYVGNMFSSAGNRIAYQELFSRDRDASTTAGLRRMARGNSLLAGSPRDAGFTDVSEAAGVTMGRWAWSSALADIDGDGWEDIVIANGYLTNTRLDDL